MTDEIYWLTLTAILTGLLSVVYVVNIAVRQWPLKGLRIIENPPQPGTDRYAWEWGHRAYGAHMNAIENLLLFAPLALAVTATGTSNSVTVLACQVYFWARAVHAIFFIAGVPYVRTLAWTVGLIATFILAGQLLR